VPVPVDALPAHPEPPSARRRRGAVGRALAAARASVGPQLRGVPAPAWVLAAMVAAYVVVFGRLTWAHHANFGTFGFDMGIYDQGIWLLSRFEDPFVTVRGLPYFGHHVNLLTVLFVPAYWLGAGPTFLYLVETVWLAVGAVPVWLLGRDHLQGARRWGPWLALVPAAAFLLHPTIQWVNWWHFHPDALMITPLLFAWWLAERRRWRWFAVAVAVALAAKEDAGLAVLVMGLLVALRERGRGGTPVGRRAGLLAAGAGLAWFLVCVRVIIPLANGGEGAFYEDFFPGFGSSLTEIVSTALVHPSRVWDSALAADRLTYYWELLAPVGFLPLGSLAALIGAPQVLVNVISGHGYTHDARFHYSSAVVAALFVATTRTLGWWGRGRVSRSVLLGVLALSAVVSNVVLSPSPLGREYDSGIWARPSPRVDVVREALALVPDGAGVSATYAYVPHLTHRAHIYEYPNPFRPAHWGLRDEGLPDPDDVVEWVVVDRRALGAHASLFDQLVFAGKFQLVFDRDEVAVARRVSRQAASRAGAAPRSPQ
jgi:uncharacterized membrane protein